LNEEARKRLIYALDTSSLSDAFKWVELLSGRVGLFKVGKEAFTSFGPELLKGIKDRGGGIFLDLKYHDIPNTVSAAALAAASWGVDMFNVHASGGSEMMRRTAEAVKGLPGQTKPIILAVTVLTSLDDNDLKEIGYRYSTAELALNLAGLAKKSGMDGVVASALEVSAIRKQCGKDFIIVTPGIRPAEGGEIKRILSDDQKRTLTPAEAIRKGADYLVVGRPIRTARDPVKTVESIVKEISQALSPAVMDGKKAEKS
jgi:orotidine-5'-phosphate decarboxylase